MKNEITIDGTTYIPKPPTDEKDRPFVIIRSRDSGVTAGYLESRAGREVSLVHCFRIWQWSGAFTLLQMAQDGATGKFSITADRMEILDACEVITCTAAAKAKLEGVERCRK